MGLDSVKQTIRYFKRNGFKDTYLAVRERLDEKKAAPYSYKEPSEAELLKQRKESLEMLNPPLISIVVPLYNTEIVYLEDLLLSVVEQSYPYYELILADASTGSAQENIAHEFEEQYGKIRYVKLETNGGISENTNQGIREAKGDYVALLDHDDVLTKDALYHMVKKVLGSVKLREYGKGPTLIYSDEDKTDAYLDKYFAPNIKPTFNLDYLLTNNYICHFSMFRRDVIQSLELRPFYDGAQDFDLILRTVLVTEEQVGKQNLEDYILHVPRVLYHWRCHEASTAGNTDSKNYAYEAGGKAIQSFLSVKGWNGEVTPLKHLGFYRVQYASLFQERPEVGVVSAPIYHGGVLRIGALKSDGTTLYGGLKEGYSGYLHRASLQQKVVLADLRTMTIREDLQKLFTEITGYSYPLSGDDKMPTEDDKKEAEILEKSKKFCNKLKSLGIEILYDPDFSEVTL